MLVFNNLKCYYAKKCQERLNNRIDEINIIRQRKGKRKLTNTYIYPNKPKVIKFIRTSSPEDVLVNLTQTVANSIVDTVKLKDGVIDELDKKVERKKKSSNLEFFDTKEFLWGDFNQLDYKTEKFFMVLNLFLDLRLDDRYLDVVNNALIDYIPFSKYIALDKVSKEDTHFGDIFVSQYRDSNIDVFAEAVYLFCMTKLSNELFENFRAILRDNRYEYDSKNSDGLYELKTTIINFQNFDKMINKSLDNILLKPIMERDMTSSLGNRIYNIIIDDFKINSEVMYLDMIDFNSYSLSMEVQRELHDISEEYSNKLFEIQKAEYGNIEIEYFESKFFKDVKTPYFSEIRLEEIIQDRELEKLEEEMRIEKAIENYENQIMEYETIIDEIEN